MKIVDHQVEKWLTDNVIEPTTPSCSWNSPLLVVKKGPKAETDYRACLDVRHLNLKLEDDKQEMPLLRSLLDKAADSKKFLL